MSQSKLDIAQSLAGDFGWHVYPVNSHKLPIWSKKSVFPNGSLDASGDEDVINELWRPYPTALVAVRLDKSGLMCIDIDRHGDVDGMKTYKRLVDQFGKLPSPTVGQTSLSGKGYHGLFKAPGAEIRKNLRGYDGVDFLHHHYIVLNQWTAKRSPWEVKVKDLSVKWFEAIKVQPKPVREVSLANGDDPLKSLSPMQYVKDLGNLTPNRFGFVECPGHEDWKPSLKVYDSPDTGWYCYQCQRGGDIYEFAALASQLPEDWKTDREQSAILFESVMTFYEDLFDVRSEF